MSSRSRIHDALSHRESDRVPRDLGGTESSGLAVHAYKNITAFFGIEAVPRVFEPYQYVSYVDDQLVEKMKIDTVNLTPGPAKWKRGVHPDGFTVELPQGWSEHTDAEGNTRVRSTSGDIVAVRPRGGYYFDPVNPPLAHTKDFRELKRLRKTIEGFDWPFFADETFESLKTRAERMHETDRCVILNLCCHILAAGQLLRGYENFMMDLLQDQRFVHTMLTILLEGYFRRIDRLSSLRPHIDVLLFNDDLGTQNGPMLAPCLYRAMIRPYQKALFRYAKEVFGRPILFHSCGSVAEFIPDLIEIGVDALNPVQISAQGMDLTELKSRFGKSITFWGGGIDTQHVLNSGGIQDVKDAVKRSVDVLAPGGGFVFCPVHNVQPDVPPENLHSAYESLDVLGTYA